MIGKQRTQLHSAIHRWLLTYEFPGAELPLGVTSRLDIYRYMIEDHRYSTNSRAFLHARFILLTYFYRYARRGYTSDGEFLYSQCIIDCIAKVLVYKRGGGWLNPVPTPISKQCIVLVTLIVSITSSYK